jgi:hypothetical protein
MRCVAAPPCSPSWRCSPRPCRQSACLPPPTSPGQPRVRGRPATERPGGEGVLSRARRRCVRERDGPGGDGVPQGDRGDPILLLERLSLEPTDLLSGPVDAGADRRTRPGRGESHPTGHVPLPKREPARDLPISSGNGEPYRNSYGSFINADTPVGDFKVQRHIVGVRESYLGTLYNPWYFTGGYALHGSLSVPAYPASHGCVRLTMWDSEWLETSSTSGSPSTSGTSRPESAPGWPARPSRSVARRHVPTASSATRWRSTTRRGGSIFGTGSPRSGRRACSTSGTPATSPSRATGTETGSPPPGSTGARTGSSTSATRTPRASPTSPSSSATPATFRSPATSMATASTPCRSTVHRRTGCT